MMIIAATILIHSLFVFRLDVAVAAAAAAIVVSLSFDCQLDCYGWLE